jgi:hypothetical protein
MKKFFILICLSFVISNAFSQTINDVAFRKAESSTPDFLTSDFVVQLSDTSQIDLIEVKVGTTDQSHDIINYSFNFDATSGLPSGYSYNRIAKSVMLSTGLIPEVPTFFGRIRLKLSNGQFTDYFSFTSN